MTRVGRQRHCGEKWAVVEAATNLVLATFISCRIRTLGQEFKHVLEEPESAQLMSGYKSEVC